MDDFVKTKEQLIRELESSRQHVTDLKGKYKKSQEGFNIAEKKLRSWLEYSPVCTKIVDLDFNLQYMSSAGINGLKIDDVSVYYENHFLLIFTLK